MPNASQVLRLSQLIASRTLTLPPAGSSSRKSHFYSMRSISAQSVLYTGSAQKTANPRKQKKPSVGRDPYKNYESPLFPAATTTWKVALEGINHSDYNLCRDFNTNPCFTRFALPDAHLIATPSNDSKKSRLSHCLAACSTIIALPGKKATGPFPMCSDMACFLGDDCPWEEQWQV